MKIAVLGGSPKYKKNSGTMQYIFYLEKQFPECEFVLFPISRTISVFSSPEEFVDTFESIKTCDAVLWAFPVYFYLVPSQYKRFIELIFEKDAVSSFDGKYSASFSTSIHNFDDIAHDYIAGISQDLNMKFVDSFSADMYDFFYPEKLEALLFFFSNFLSIIKKNGVTQKRFHTVLQKPIHLDLPCPVQSIDAAGKKILILADSLHKNGNLIKMCSFFSESFTQPPEILVLDKLKIKNGCTGCLVCGYNNDCALSDSEIFEDIHSKIFASDIIVFAGEIRDRFFSSLWKLFFDRLFSCGHPPNIFINKQIGFLISGPLRDVSSLSRFIHAFTGMEKINLAGIITDETPEITPALLSDLAERLVTFSRNKYMRPLTFPGVGGIKICRDDLWGRHSWIFQSDLKSYKKNRIFDFPQKHIGMFLNTRLLRLLTKLPFFRKLVYKNIAGLLASSFRKIVK